MVEIGAAQLHPLAARLRQAALGCTIHTHGPVNAFAAIIEADRAGEVDGESVVDAVLERCHARLDTATGLDAARELRLIEVLTVFKAGMRACHGRA